MADPGLLDRLAQADLVIEGRVAGASNATLRAHLEGTDLACVYKPVKGERPLWDFPHWTLTRRELAAFALSEALGWHLVPPTAWREDGPAGEGMCQAWIDEDPDASQVDVVPAGRVPAGWVSVLDATDEWGRPVELVHAGSLDLQRIAVFDALANNADRKGGHVLTDGVGRVWAIDHGVAFSAEEKLRTVLWGWAAEEIPEPILADLHRLQDLLGTSYDPVDRWLDDAERDRLRARLRRLLRSGRFPEPGGGWPAIPWPVF